MTTEIAEARSFASSAIGTSPSLDAKVGIQTPVTKTTAFTLMQSCLPMNYPQFPIPPERFGSNYIGKKDTAGRRIQENVSYL